MPPDFASYNQIDKFGHIYGSVCAFPRIRNKYKGASYFSSAVLLSKI
jgi:hypothetical protein